MLLKSVPKLFLRAFLKLVGSFFSVHVTPMINTLIALLTESAYVLKLLTVYSSCFVIDIKNIYNVLFINQILFYSFPISHSFTSSTVKLLQQSTSDWMYCTYCIHHSLSIAHIDKSWLENFMSWPAAYRITGSVGLK